MRGLPDTEKSRAMSLVFFEKNSVTIKPEKDIVASTCGEFKTELIALVHNEMTELVIDFEDVEMVDSSGISVIIAAYNSVGKVGGKLKIVNTPHDVYKLLRTMRLNDHFHIEEKKTRPNRPGAVPPDS